MSFKEKDNDTGLRVGSIVYFKFLGTKRGIVTERGPSQDTYIVDFIDYANKEKKLSRVTALRGDIIDTSHIVKQDYLESVSDVVKIKALEEINAQIPSIVPQRQKKLTHNVPQTQRTSSKIIIDGDVFTPVDGGYRAKSIRRRSKKNRRKTKRNRRKH